MGHTGLCPIEFLLLLADPGASLLDFLFCLCFLFVSVFGRFLVLCSTLQIPSPSNTHTSTCVSAVRPQPGDGLGFSIAKGGEQRARVCVARPPLTETHIPAYHGLHRHPRCFLSLLQLFNTPSSLALSV